MYLKNSFFIFSSFIVICRLYYSSNEEDILGCFLGNFLPVQPFHKVSKIETVLLNKLASEVRLSSTLASYRTIFSFKKTGRPCWTI
ncbi:MAG: hypothetical protein A2Z24_02590 [Candidatus Woykebacteria bacterium RBG_16_44_10]|uniref:Uncharacterized protein n=1 Tax=Candidatus Woykebacteria bacterium RBG_16_44_10 TaxID=1802597 RepID=A0A1G1WE59_9BACT|nr:MAG: hypothetical protein A2Z24_02590 [Candidatus Woykebacteria bacterium RBG_16_44_10]